MVETAKSVQVFQIERTDELFQHYDRQDEPQDCYLSLDLASGGMTCDYNAVVGSNAVPAGVYYRQTLRFRIPPLTAAAANQLLEDARPYAERILAGAAIEWDGNNHVGRLDADAAAAEEELQRLCDGDQWAESDQVVEYSAAIWFSEETDEELAQRLGITADTTEAQLRIIVAEQEQEATTDGTAGWTVLGGAFDYLLQLRERLREPVRARLAEVGREAAALIVERDQLIRQLAKWGESGRVIGAMAQLSHTRVQNIINQTPTEDS